MGRSTARIEVNLIELIKVARECGVATLRYGDLDVVFGDTWPKQQLAVSINRNEGILEEEVSREDDDLVKQRQLDELLITDPEAFEKLQAEESQET